MDAIVVTANSRNLLEQMLTCQPLRQSFDRVIVVDHVSSDDSVAVARRHGADVIGLNRPLGYGGAVNVGARHAEGASFAVLNPDITFDDIDVVPRLVAHFDDAGVGLVAPALVLPNGELQGSARHIPTPLDLVLRRRLNPDCGVVRESGDVAWVVGAFFIVRRDAWDEVGGFDERYFLYFEDVDLCWRLRKRGWITRYDASVRVRHSFQGASRQGILGWATRTHLISAARFYYANPRFILARNGL